MLLNQAQLTKRNDQQNVTDQLTKNNYRQYFIVYWYTWLLDLFGFKELFLYYMFECI